MREENVKKNDEKSSLANIVESDKKTIFPAFHKILRDEKLKEIKEEI